MKRIFSKLKMTHAQANLISVSANVTVDPGRVQKVEESTLGFIYGCRVSAKYSLSQGNGRYDRGLSMLS